MKRTSEFICNRSFQGFLKSRETPSDFGARQGAKMTNISLHCWDLREEKGLPPSLGKDGISAGLLGVPSPLFPGLDKPAHSDAISGRACPTVLMKLQWFIPFERYDFSDNVTLSPPIPDRDLGTHFAMTAPKETSHYQHSSLHRASSPHPDPPSPSTSTHLICMSTFQGLSI